MSNTRSQVLHLEAKTGLIVFIASSHLCVNSICMQKILQGITHFWHHAYKFWAWHLQLPTYKCISTPAFGVAETTSQR